MLRLAALASSLFFIVTVLGQNVQSPKEFLSYELGTYFTRHHQVVDYFKQLEKNAPGNLKLIKYGSTNENRDLVVAYISSAENLKNLEAIRQSHTSLNKDEKTAIVWLSYNVHGNESAGTEAAMQTAYELITQKQEWLKNTVVILDPCINPDGRDRYVNWYNQVNTGNVLYDAAEHNEPWPSGRPNHYLFDLNRDWAWLTQKESQQRIALYNEWLPHVHVDFHEQGMDAPYYFAPAAEPYHEVITNWQREFQTGVGRNNADYFDQYGWFYFTKEIFDLLYPSYGDTYPTYNGAIGMTYEQGGSGTAGLGVINSDGDTITLVDRVRHHHITGLSTVEYSSLQASKLVQEFQSFAKNKKYKYKSFILGGNEDNLVALRKLLDAHKIAYSFGGNLTVKGFDYKLNGPGTMKATEKHLIVSTDQFKGTLVNVLFEPRTKLTDSLTYDITAWSLPYAYGLDAIASESLVSGFAEKTSPLSNQAVAGSYAYLADWNSMTDARFLADLLKHGIRVRTSEDPFTLKGKNYQRGTLIITKGDNDANYESKLIKIANEHKVVLTATPTGMVDKGRDFGADAVKLIKPRKIALITDASASSLNVGEVWHFFEEQLDYPLSVVQLSDLTRSVLDKYDVLIVPEGWYSELSTDDVKNALKEWIYNGGKVIAIGGAVNYFTDASGYSLKAKTEEGEEKEEEAKPTGERHEHAHLPYEAQEREAIKNMITGAIFRCKVETTHPLAFGYGDTYFTLKLSVDAYNWLENGSNVVYLEEKPELIAGFAGSKALPKQPKTLVFGQENVGNGSVIYMIDNPLFRGFWENGKLFFVNALFMTNN
ncbi:MAG: M14 metallopeptidase family protein [Flavobacteriia bacterium]